MNKFPKHLYMLWLTADQYGSGRGGHVLAIDGVPDDTYVCFSSQEAARTHREAYGLGDAEIVKVV